MAESTALAQKREVVITLDQIRQLTGFELAEIALIRHKMAASMGKPADQVPLLDVALFCQANKELGFSAIINQSHWISRAGKGGFQPGIDGFRAIADRSGCYAGSSEPVFRGTIEWPYKGGKRIVPEYAQVTVWKIVANHKGAFTGEARWVEFVPDENNAFMWAKMPRHMLAKCAEAQALRKAFSLQLGSMPFSADAGEPGGEIEIVAAPRKALPQYDEIFSEESFDLPTREQDVEDVTIRAPVGTAPEPSGRMAAPPTSPPTTAPKPEPQITVRHPLASRLAERVEEAARLEVPFEDCKVPLPAPKEQVVRAIEKLEDRVEAKKRKLAGSPEPEPVGAGQVQF